MSDWENLTEAVQNAARDFLPGTESFRWSKDGEEIGHWPESARDLVDAINNMGTLSLFHGRKVQWIHTQAYITTPVHFAEWLIRIAKRHEPKGAEFAVSSLQKYVDEGTVQFHQVRPLADVDRATDFGPFQFSNGVTFVDAGGVPNGSLAHELTKNPSVAMPACWSVLYTSHQHPVHHTASAHQDEPPAASVDLCTQARSIEDTMHCLSLVTPVDSGVFGMSITCVPDEATPCNETHRGWGIMPIEAPTRQLFISSDDLGAANELIKAFDRIKLKDRKALRVAMRHLNAFGARLPSEERAVHLRIALEAIFLHGDSEKTQLRYRLSTRAAWSLGSNPDDRVRYRRLFQKAYDTASKAVHEGEISPGDLANLNEVAELAQKVLRKFIADEGYPTDWGLLELGG